MSPVALIASSEYVRRVRSPWFIATTLLTPVLALGLFTLPLLMMSLGSDDGAARTLAIVDPTGALADSVAAGLPAAFTAKRTALPADSLRAAVLAGDLGGYLVLAPGVLDGTARARYYSRGGGLEEIAAVSGAVTAAVRDARVRRAGAAAEVVALLDAPVGLDQVSVSETGDAADGALVQLFVANTLALLIYVAVLLYGAMVMRGVIEEKANRIVEVVASSVRPFQLLMGKVLGIGAVGLTQLVGWGALMALGAAVAGPVLLAMAPAAGAVPGAAAELPVDPAALSAAFAPGLLAAFVAYFCGGYLLFAAVFAAIGSAVDQESDAQTLQVPVMIPIIVPMLFLPAVLNAPSGGLAVFLSLFPVSSPVLMVVRMSVSEVPAWQIAVSLGLLVAAFVGMIWVAARVYRVGILMTGKKATFADLWRWVRTA